ncbi:hypothetical protein D9M72_560440 [compost metagenome]
MRLVLLGRVVGPGIAEMVVTAVRPMDLVEVDIVGFQASKAGVDCLFDAFRRGRTAIANIGPAGAGDLGREHDVVAAAALCQPLADEALGIAVGLGRERRRRVEFCRIDEIHALVEGVVQLFMRFGDGIL